MWELGRSRGTAVWIAAILALGANTAVSVYNLRELIETTNQVNRSNRVLMQLRMYISAVKDAEIGQRGYLITGGQDYLRPYEDGRNLAGEQLAGLKQLTRDDSPQQSSVLKLESLTIKKLTELRISIALMNTVGSTMAWHVTMSDVGRQYMEEIRAEVATMEQRENDLLASRAATARAKHQATIVTTVVGDVLTLGMTGLAFVLIRRELERRRLAEAESTKIALELRLRANDLSTAHRQNADLITLLESYFANTPIGLAFLNHALRFIRINRVLAEANDLTVAAHIGITLTEMPESFLAKALPDLKHVIETRDPVLDRLLYKPTSSTGGGQTWQASMYPLLSPAGALLGVGLIARDITQRLRDERALVASQARFRSLAESMPQIVWVAGPDGQIDYFNERWHQFTGLTLAESRALGWIQALHEEDKQRAEQHWHESIAIAKPYEIENRFRRRDGVYRWFLGRALPQRDESGAVLNWFGTYTDIHDRKTQNQALEEMVQDRARALIATNAILQEEIEIRKTAEQKERDAAEELRRSNHELEQFAYVASHDLQEPLRKIQAFGDRLAQKYGGTLDEQGEQYLQRITASASRMRNLINDLLSFSRISTRTQPFVEVDLAEIVRDVLSDLEERIHQTNGEVDVGPLPRIDADPMQIRQLLLNLVANALKFHRPEVPSRVTVRAETYSKPNVAAEEPLRDYCRITVSDNGIGFDEKYVDRIFQVFQRLHGRSQYEGTGIGLAICRKIVERHSGEIGASSVPGQGSNFWVILPLHQENPPDMELGSRFE